MSWSGYHQHSRIVWCPFGTLRKAYRPCHKVCCLGTWYARGRTGLEEQHIDILGLKIPTMEIPVRPGRDMARLTEVAAMSQALKKIGHDSAAEFNDRLIAHMRKSKSAE